MSLKEVRSSVRERVEARLSVSEEVDESVDGSAADMVNLPKAWFRSCSAWEQIGGV